MSPAELQMFVLREMSTYFEGYEAPAPGTGLGTPWSKEVISIELEKMRALLVQPYESSYLCGDSVDVKKHPPFMKKAWVVAVDGIYRLLFDPEANDFVLVHASDAGEMFSWGIRGDASSTFLAR